MASFCCPAVGERGCHPQRLRHRQRQGDRHLTGHDNVVLATAFSPDGRWAATGGGRNQEIHLWDPHSGKPRPGPDGKPLRLAGQGQPV